MLPGHGAVNPYIQVRDADHKTVTLWETDSDQEENVKDLLKYTTEFVIPYSNTGIPEESVKNF